MGNNENNTVMPWIQEIKVPLALISYTYRMIQKRFAKDLAPYHIGWGNFAILMAVYEVEGRSQDDIALSRGFDKTMIAKSVVKLEQEGLIYRLTDPGDKRVKRLYATDKGWALQTDMQQTAAGICKILLKDFKDNETAIALEFLRKMAMNASEM